MGNRSPTYKTVEEALASKEAHDLLTSWFKREAKGVTWKEARAGVIPERSPVMPEHYAPGGRFDEALPGARGDAKLLREMLGVVERLKKWEAQTEKRKVSVGEFFEPLRELGELVQPWAKKWRGAGSPDAFRAAVGGLLHVLPAEHRARQWPFGRALRADEAAKLLLLLGWAPSMTESVARKKGVVTLGEVVERQTARVNEACAKLGITLRKRPRGRPKST